MIHPKIQEYLDKRNLFKVKLYALGHTLLCVWASLLYFETFPEGSDFSYETTNLIIGVTAVFYSVAAYYFVKLGRLDALFGTAKFSLKFSFFSVLAFLGFVLYLAIVANEKEHFDLLYNGNIPYSFYQFLAATLGAFLLFSWYFLVGIINGLIKGAAMWNERAPSVAKKAGEVIEDSLEFAKKQYDQSSLPLKKKLKREKLLAELADLGEVEPEKRAFTKADYQSKKKDIDEIADLERQLRVKKLEKELRELKDDSPPS